MSETPASNDARPAVLGLWDAVSIIIGIVVGTSIFKSSPMVFNNVSSAGAGMALWALGGGLSLVGALCYAELATAYPRSGGDYVYLTKAFGRWIGFQFGWAHLAGILTGSIGAMAFVFAEYSSAFFGGGEHAEALRAMTAVVLLTGLNILGVIFGKATQNALTAAKVVGLTAIVAAGLFWGGGQSLAATRPMTQVGPSLAMIFILYAFGGWSDAAFVAAEVRDARRNIPRALLCGIAGIAAIYLLVNLGYLRGLGFEGLRDSRTPAADVLAAWLGTRGQQAMSLLVMVSSLGALNGLVFTGSRVHATLGTDHRLFGWLGRWHPTLGTPVIALVVQSLVTVTLITLVGIPEGRGGLNRALAAVGLNPIPWDQYGGGFETLVSATAPVYWLFFLLTGLALFVLRFRDPATERSFRVPFYPVTPAIFCLMCAWMLKASLAYAGKLSLIGFVPLALGAPAYWWSERGSRG